MDKQKFKQHLDDSLRFLVELTGRWCFNEFSDNYKFSITPNSRTPHSGLNKDEIRMLRLFNTYEGILFSRDEVIDLLHHNNKVPLWINTTIYESLPDLTIVNLFCSRRFREDKDLLYFVDKYAPFHLLVPVPFEYSSSKLDCKKVEVDGKYDINFQKQLPINKSSITTFKKPLNRFKRMVMV